MIELSLRPYNGRLFVVKSAKEYEKQHSIIFTEPDVLNCSAAGRMAGGCGVDGMWTYLVFAENAAIAAHEFAHVLFSTFKRCNIEPDAGNEEPFCYMLSQLMIDIGYGKKLKY